MELTKFNESYNMVGEQFVMDVSYPPTVLNRNTGKRMSLLEYAEACVSLDESTVLATRLKDHVKVFTHWDVSSYHRGDPGDWLVARSPDDLYVVTADVFEKLYIRDRAKTVLLSQRVP